MPRVARIFGVGRVTPVLQSARKHGNTAGPAPDFIPENIVVASLVRMTTVAPAECSSTDLATGDAPTLAP